MRKGMRQAELTKGGRVCRAINYCRAHEAELKLSPTDFGRNSEPRLQTISTGQRGSACMNALPYDLFRILLSRITTIP